MGQTCSYEILGHVSHLNTFFKELQNLLIAGKQEVQITLPDGEKTRLKAALKIDLNTQQAGCYHIQLPQQGHSETLALSINIPMDHIVKDYYLEEGIFADHHQAQSPDKIIGLPRSIKLGYIYFNISLDSEHYRASFWAATSDMSRLFQASLSIRLLFTQLMIFGQAKYLARDNNSITWEILDETENILPFDTFIEQSSATEIVNFLDRQKN